MQPIYLIEHQGLRARYFIETDRDSNSRERVIEMIRSGEVKPVKVLQISEDEGTVSDVTAELLQEACDRLPDNYRTAYSKADAAAWADDRRRAIEMAE